MNQLSFVLQIFSCFFMTGLIWLVQVVHYPAYSFIDLARFGEYQRFHTNTITWIVGPVMLIELVTGAYWVFEAQFSQISVVNLCGIIAIWLVTVLLSVPAHNQLSAGFSSATLAFLINTNWLRTGLWSARSLLLCCIVFKQIR